MDRDCMIIVPQTMHDTLYEANEIAKAGGHEIDLMIGLGDARTYLTRVRDQDADVFPNVIDPNGRLHVIPKPYRFRVAEILESFTFCVIVSAKLTKAHHGDDQGNAGSAS